MHLFSMMTIGMFFSHAIGRRPQQDAPINELDLRRVREENGRNFRETTWRSDGEDEISESMFRIIGPLNSQTTSRPKASTTHQKASSTRPKTVGARRKTTSIQSQMTENNSASLAAEAVSVAVTTISAPPVKKMILFFDDTLEP
jgi:hypothetical protein